MPNREVTTTFSPESPIEFVGRQRLSEGQRNGLALSLRLGVEAALGDRKAKEDNLADWNKIYECQGDQKIDYPWKDASDVKLPLAATQMDAFVAYVAAAAFGQRFYRVTGLTPEAQEHAPIVERYYNAELMKHRTGAPTWHEAHVRQIMLGARDGVGVIEALWRTTKRTQKIAHFTKRLHPETLEPVLDDTGRQQYDKSILTVDVNVYDDVQLMPVPLRNIITIPAAALSIDEAVAVAKVEYLYESQLKEMVRAGILDAGEVEAALSYVPIGVSELPASEQPLEIYTAGGQVSTGSAQGPQTTEFFGQRGPIEVYRVHTNQYDLDGDGQVEENIFWVHRTSWRMLGWMPSQYWAEHRPFFAFAPLPRPEQFWGFSIIERMGAYDQELDAIWNQRNNMINLGLGPPLWKRRGSDADTDENSWRPNTTWYSSSFDDFQWVKPPDVNPISIEQEQALVQYAEKMLGLSNPAVGMMNSGRRTAAEVRQVAAATSARMNLAVMRFRANAREIVNFVHQLKKQYQGDERAVVDGNGSFVVPPDILNLPYQIDVWGGDDPSDVATRRTEVMSLYDIASKSPIAASNPLIQHALLQIVWDSFERPDFEAIFGRNEQIMEQIKQQTVKQVLTQLQTAAQGQQPGQANGQPPQAQPAPQPQEQGNEQPS